MHIFLYVNGHIKRVTAINGHRLLMNTREAVLELLNNVLGGHVTVSDAMRQVRDVYYPRLLQENALDVLDSPFDGKTLRSGVWRLFLDMRKYSLMSAEEAASNVTPTLMKRIDGELTRFFDARKESETGVTREAFRFWLVQVSAWLQEKEKVDFDQRLYVFGVLFLRNMDQAGAFQAFAKFYDQIGSGSSRQFEKIACGRVGDLVRAYDSELGAFMKKRPEMSPLVISYAHLASFFTHMKPIEGVEKLWDFLIIYGQHFIVYIEAAWLIMHREQIMKGFNPIDERYKDLFLVDKPAQLLRLAAKVYQSVSDDLRNQIVALMCP